MPDEPQVSGHAERGTPVLKRAPVAAVTGQFVADDKQPGVRYPPQDERDCVKEHLVTLHPGSPEGAHRVAYIWAIMPTVGVPSARPNSRRKPAPERCGSILRTSHP